MVYVDEIAVPRTVNYI